MIRNHNLPRNTNDAIPREIDSEGEGDAAARTVSVVIPCYNQAHYLGEAIESVLSQSYRHFEVVVVDDGSPDNTSEVAARYPEVHCVRQENRGLSGARNSGLHHSRGEYLVFLDADDRLLPEALEIGIRELEADPDRAFVSGHCRLISSDGSYHSTPSGSRIEGDCYRELLLRNYVWTPGLAMFRRTIVESVGHFDTSINPVADWDLYFRIAREFPVHHHGEVVAEYRQHGTNMTRDPALMLRTTVALLRAQRKHIEGNEQYEKAYRRGLRTGKEFYGDPLADEVRTYIKMRRWGRVLRGVLALVRYYPQGIPLLSERRMQQHRVTRQLQTLQWKLESRKHKLRKHRRRLRTLQEEGLEIQDGRLEDELGSTLRKERKEIRRLRRRITRLEQRFVALDQHGWGNQRIRLVWGSLKELIHTRGKAPRG